MNHLKLYEQYISEKMSINSDVQDFAEDIYKLLKYIQDNLDVFEKKSCVVISINKENITIYDKVLDYKNDIQKYLNIFNIEKIDIYNNKSHNVNSCGIDNKRIVIYCKTPLILSELTHELLHMFQIIKKDYKKPNTEYEIYVKFLLNTYYRTNIKPIISKVDDIKDDSDMLILLFFFLYLTNNIEIEARVNQFYKEYKDKDDLSLDDVNSFYTYPFHSNLYEWKKLFTKFDKTKINNALKKNLIDYVKEIIPKSENYDSVINFMNSKIEDMCGNLIKLINSKNDPASYFEKILEKQSKKFEYRLHKIYNYIKNN